MTPRGRPRMNRVAPAARRSRRAPGLQPPVSTGQAAKGSTDDMRGPASDRVRRAPTAAARDTSLARAGTFH